MTGTQNVFEMVNGKRKKTGDSGRNALKNQQLRTKSAKDVFTIFRVHRVSVLRTLRGK